MTNTPIIISIRVTPNAKIQRIIEMDHQDKDDNPRLKIYVNAPPENGKANKAVIKLLAKYYHTSPSKISINTGETSRNKTIKIQS